MELCGACDRPVSGRQHGMVCDTCSRWQHRTCGIGISQAQYRKMMRKELVVHFICCRDHSFQEMETHEVSVEESQEESVEIQDAGTQTQEADMETEELVEESVEIQDAGTQTQESVGMETQEESVGMETQEESEETTEEPVETRIALGDFTMNASFLSVSTSSTLAEGPEPVNFDRSFDIDATFGGNDTAIEERDIEDPALSTTVLEEETTTYTVVTGGTKRGGKKLVSSEGYSYTVKKADATTTTWRCSVRSTALWCRASVVERRGTFTLRVIPHCHPGDPGLLKKTVVRAEVCTEARTHAYKSATDIVEEKITSNIGEGDFNLPKLSNEIRAANKSVNQVNC